jgi:hypothetical protein
MASITLGKSIPLGQRETHVKQDAQVQMVDESSASSMPNCASRITWFGSRSILNASGQPALHFPHWLQLNKFSPLIVSICLTNSLCKEAIEILVLISLF